MLRLAFACAATFQMHRDKPVRWIRNLLQGDGHCRKELIEHQLAPLGWERHARHQRTRHPADGISRLLSRFTLSQPSKMPAMF